MTRRNARKPRSRREAWTALAFLLPSLAGLAAMFFIPTADVIRRSFYSAMGNSFVHLDNYKLVLENASFRLAVKNTLRFLAVCIPLLLVLSLIAALLLYRRKRFQNLFRTSLLLPLVVPVTSVVLVMQVVFTRNGLLSALCAAFGRTPADWLNSEYAFYVLVASYLWKNLGYNVILWMAGLSAIPESLYEAARVDGASEIRCFFAITLPQLSGTLFVTAVLALINSFKVFREAYLVAGQYPHSSIYLLQHVLSNWFTNLDMQKISAAAVLLMGVILIFVAVIQRLTQARGEQA